MAGVFEDLVQAALNFALDKTAARLGGEGAPARVTARAEVEDHVFLAVDEVGEMEGVVLPVRGTRAPVLPAFMRRTSKASRLLGGDVVQDLRSDPGRRQDVGQALAGAHGAGLDLQCHAVGKGKAHGFFLIGVRAGAAGTSLARSGRRPPAHRWTPRFPHPNRPTLSRKRTGRRCGGWSMEVGTGNLWPPFRNGGVGQKFCRRRLLTLPSPIAAGLTCGRCGS